jgi:hypothetical protein
MANRKLTKMIVLTATVGSLIFFGAKTLALYEEIPASFTFQQNLRFGDYNNDVRYLQTILKNEGVFCRACRPTGFFDLATKNSVKLFQEKYRPEILSSFGFSRGTGFAGATTRAKLNQILAASRPGRTPTPSPSPTSTPTPTPTVFDFNISVSPASVSVNKGLAISVSLNAASISGQNYPVFFSFSNLPNDTNVVFSTNNCNLNCSPTASLQTSNSTPTGTFNIQVVASANNLTKNASFSLTVNPSTPTPSPTPTLTSTPTPTPLAVSLAATPNSGPGPLKNVGFKAEVSGTVQGTINYKFDCTADGSWEKQVDHSNQTSLEATDLCLYFLPGNYTAKVFIERGNSNAQATADIIVSEVASVGPKVFSIVFNPIIESTGNKRLTEVKNWNSPSDLNQQYVKDVKEASNDFVNYQIVRQVEIDDFPQLLDGFDYNDQSYLACLQNEKNCHQPTEVDYKKILQDQQACEKLNSGEIDEVWLWGGPWFGYYESRLAGPNAFWYNSPPLAGTNCQKLLPIMGFNYERGVAEMLEDLGHRTEAALTHVFGSWHVDQSNHDWDRFTHNRGQTPRVNYFQCGNVHFAPNSLSDYDWSRLDYVYSNCDDWFNYPNLSGSSAAARINCAAWNCDAREHKKWWLNHLPRAKGASEGVFNNWWRYVVDFNHAFVKSSKPTVKLKINEVSESEAGPNMVYIDYNSNISLSWKAESVFACQAADDWSGSKDLSGSETKKNITTSKTYTLKCDGPWGSIKKSISAIIPTDKCTLASIWNGKQCKPITLQGQTRIIGLDAPIASRLELDEIERNFIKRSFPDFPDNLFDPQTRSLGQQIQDLRLANMPLASDSESGPVYQRMLEFVINASTKNKIDQNLNALGANAVNLLLKHAEQLDEIWQNSSPSINRRAALDRIMVVSDDVLSDAKGGWNVPNNENFGYWANDTLNDVPGFIPFDIDSRWVVAEKWPDLILSMEGHPLQRRSSRLRPAPRTDASFARRRQLYLQSGQRPRLLN